jgi:hypothetical protein
LLPPLFAKPDAPKRNTALIIGALLPDAVIFGLFGWAVLTGVPQSELWGRIYFSEPMLTFTAIGNSAPLYVAIALLGWFWVRSWTGAPMPMSRSQRSPHCGVGAGRLSPTWPAISGPCG